MAERRRIVAMGGGGYSMEPDNPLLDRFVVDQAARRRRRPTVCYLGTAGGEQERFTTLPIGVTAAQQPLQPHIFRGK